MWRIRVEERVRCLRPPPPPLSTAPPPPLHLERGGLDVSAYWRVVQPPSQSLPITAPPFQLLNPPPSLHHHHCITTATAIITNITVHLSGEIYTQPPTQPASQSVGHPSQPVSRSPHIHTHMHATKSTKMTSSPNVNGTRARRIRSVCRPFLVTSSSLHLLPFAPWQVVQTLSHPFPSSHLPCSPSLPIPFPFTSPSLHLSHSHRGKWCKSYPILSHPLSFPIPHFPSSPSSSSLPISSLPFTSPFLHPHSSCCCYCDSHYCDCYCNYR